MGKTFESIFHQYYSPLCNYATKIVGDEHISKDLVQSLFIQLWEKDKLATVNNLEYFLLRSIKFKCIDYLRARKKHQEIPIEDLPDSPILNDENLSEEDVEPLLHFFAAKLPPKTRRVFLLSRQEGLSYKEIAQELNVSVKTVDNQMGAALKKMRILLKAQQFFSLLLFL